MPAPVFPFTLMKKKKCGKSGFECDYPPRYAIEQSARFSIFDELICRPHSPHRKRKPKAGKKSIANQSNEQLMKTAKHDMVGCVLITAYFRAILNIAIKRQLDSGLCAVKTMFTGNENWCSISILINNYLLTPYCDFFSLLVLIHAIHWRKALESLACVFSLVLDFRP